MSESQATLPTLVNCPDDELMRRLQEGDSRAFAELTQRYWHRLFSFFVREFGDRQDAEDLTQEVFLRVYRARHGYEPRARVATWLFHIARNVARNARRTQRRRPRIQPVPTADGQSVLNLEHTAISSDQSCPVEAIFRHELADLVHEAVAELNERQRQAIELHQFQHQSCAEIARRMATTPKAAKALLYRARLQLRDRLSRAVCD